MARNTTNRMRPDAKNVYAQSEQSTRMLDLTHGDVWISITNETEGQGMAYQVKHLSCKPDHLSPVPRLCTGESCPLT